MVQCVNLAASDWTPFGVCHFCIAEIVLIIFHSLPQEHEQLSYSSTRTKAPSVIISGLKPATWYVFSVRTRSPAGYSSYSHKYEYETTGDCKYPRTICSTCSCGRIHLSLSQTSYYRAAHQFAPGINMFSICGASDRLWSAHNRLLTAFTPVLWAVSFVMISLRADGKSRSEQR